MLSSAQPTLQERVAYLKTLPAIRERCSRVHDLALRSKLEYFDYHPTKETDVIQYCIQIMKRDFGSNFSSIPPHSRWRHLDANHPRINDLILTWESSSPPPPESEICKRLLDLFLVSVLLDAGAGDHWKYVERSTSEFYSRSEGLAVASLDMFNSGFFSGDRDQPFRVDASGLELITISKAAIALQVDNETNPMSGLEGRILLLSRLAAALRARPDFFGKDARPGNILDFLSNKIPAGKSSIHISILFHILIEGLTPIWPARIQIAGVPLGDVWPCSVLRSSEVRGEDTEALVPFHKLTQWLAYSLVEPIEKILGWKVEGMEDMTGLPEYRNGGLLVDLGVLSLRRETLEAFFPSPDSQVPRLPPSHPAIIEWRAMTVIELFESTISRITTLILTFFSESDRIAQGIRESLNLTVSELTLAQVLESATWRGGREIAKTKRPETGGPPIEIESDGTVF